MYFYCTVNKTDYTLLLFHKMRFMLPQLIPCTKYSILFRHFSINFTIFNKLIVCIVEYILCVCLHSRMVLVLVVLNKYISVYIKYNCFILFHRMLLLLAALYAIYNKSGRKACFVIHQMKIQSRFS